MSAAENEQRLKDLRARRARWEKENPRDARVSEAAKKRREEKGPDWGQGRVRGSEAQAELVEQRDAPGFGDDAAPVFAVHGHYLHGGPGIHGVLDRKVLDARRLKEAEEREQVRAARKAARERLPILPVVLRNARHPIPHTALQ